MSIDDDLSVSLPQPPPPHRARREAAIEAALRRFDGADEESPAAERPRLAAAPWWTKWRQPQFGVALSAAIVVAIGLPAAIIAIRDQPPAPAEQAVAPRMSEPRPTPVPDAADALRPRSEPEPKAEITEPPAAVPTATAPPSDRPTAQANNDARRAEASPSAAFAPAAPPPPPPPPPAPQAPPVVAESGAGQAPTSDMIVTGSRVRSPSLDRTTSKAAKRAADAAERAPDGGAGDPAYVTFLTRLQSAVRANDRGAMIKLIAFPLRVNSNGRSPSYSDARSVRRDFDRIFTPRVRQAILAQRSDQLFTRDQGAMIGDGEVWFDHTCLNSGCTALGPVRIIAVNP